MSTANAVLRRPTGVGCSALLGGRFTLVNINYIQIPQRVKTQHPSRAPTSGRVIKSNWCPGVSNLNAVQGGKVGPLITSTNAQQRIKQHVTRQHPDYNQRSDS